eukprot:TRINITY_DN1470_c0_g1_i7.p1 TRINITY_DN1470_c0_g1~~TRINITY_DN1470_c0_g1_i7.p1  ORF type:complete len:146 (-),score=23.86 TRINITY_DN1470_c0_g1_i7:815-1252(-)
MQLSQRVTSVEGRLQSLTSRFPFQLVTMDFVTHLPKTAKGNCVLFVMTDHYTKWVEIAALPGETAELAAQELFDRIIMRHGAPEILLSDNGKAFRSKLLEYVSRLFEIHQRFTTALCSEHQLDWDTHLAAVQFVCVIQKRSGAAS